MTPAFHLGESVSESCNMNIGSLELLPGPLNGAELPLKKLAGPVRFLPDEISAVEKVEGVF